MSAWSRFSGLAAAIVVASAVAGCDVKLKTIDLIPTAPSATSWGKSPRLDSSSSWKRRIPPRILTFKLAEAVLELQCDG